MPNEGIDLGNKPGKEMSKEAAMAPREVYYPTLHLSNVDGLDELPEGEFTFTAKGKVTSYTERVTDGKKSCSCELEVHNIKPSTKKMKKEKDADERLDDSFDKIAKKKAKAYEEDEE